MNDIDSPKDGSTDNPETSPRNDRIQNHSSDADSANPNNQQSHKKLRERINSLFQWAKTEWANVGFHQRVEIVLTSLIVVATFVNVLATIVYVTVSILTFRAANASSIKTSQQTDQLICAADIQAQATQTISGYTGTQVKIMGQQNVLQRQIANGILGAPLVNLRPDWLGLYNVQQGQRLTVEVQLENNGKPNGYLGRVAFDVKFLAERPKPQFTDSDFRATNQPTLYPPPYHAIARKDITQPISSQQYAAFKLGQTKLYIWGQIRFYNPITGEQPTIDFCRYVTSTPEVLNAVGKVKGYAGTYGICDGAAQ
jgi:hypothetical protein